MACPGSGGRASPGYFVHFPSQFQLIKTDLQIASGYCEALWVNDSTLQKFGIGDERICMCWQIRQANPLLPHGRGIWPSRACAPCFRSCKSRPW